MITEKTVVVRGKDLYCKIYIKKENNKPVLFMMYVYYICCGHTEKTSIIDIYSKFTHW